MKIEIPDSKFEKILGSLTTFDLLLDLRITFSNSGFGRSEHNGSVRASADERSVDSLERLLWAAERVGRSRELRISVIAGWRDS